MTRPVHWIGTPIGVCERKDTKAEAGYIENVTCDTCIEEIRRPRPVPWSLSVWDQDILNGLVDAELEVRVEVLEKEWPTMTPEEIRQEEQYIRNLEKLGWRLLGREQTDQDPHILDGCETEEWYRKAHGESS